MGTYKRNKPASSMGTTGSLGVSFAAPLTRGGFPGGMSRPHQMSVDTEGNVYIASWDGGWVNKYTPKPGANPDHLVGKEINLKK